MAQINEILKKAENGEFISVVDAVDAIRGFQVSFSALCSATFNEMDAKSRGVVCEALDKAEHTIRKYLHDAGVPDTVVWAIEEGKDLGCGAPVFNRLYNPEDVQAIVSTLYSSNVHEFFYVPRSTYSADICLEFLKRGYAVTPVDIDTPDAHAAFLIRKEF